MTTNTAIPWSLLLIALSFFYLPFSATIATAHSHNEVSRERGTVSNDDEKTQTIQENGNKIDTSARIHSNQDGLLLVSVHLEIEERRITSIPSSSDNKDSLCIAKDREERALLYHHTFDVQKSNIASLRSNF